MVNKQVGVVFDINKCMGCQTCTVACKMLWTDGNGADHQWWVKVNTMPGRGSPRDWEKMGGGYDSKGKVSLGRLPTLEEFGEAWEFDYEGVFNRRDGENSYIHPKKKASWGPNWDEDIGAGDYPNSYFFYLPRLCNHCSHPPCVEACPVGAMKKRAEDGIVAIDPGACEGSKCKQECSMACPYKVIYRNTSRPVSQMCHFCLPRVERGVAVSCVRQCPGRAAWVDYLGNKEGVVAQLINVWKVALPLHPEYNTGPNVYYIPPLSPPSINRNGGIDANRPRIPPEYMRQLFGVGVDGSLETLKGEMSKRRRGEKSGLMDILISRRWKERLGAFQAEPSEVKS